MLRLLSFLLFCLCFVACGEQTEVVENTTEDGNIERYTRLVKDYAKQGKYTLTNTSGVLLEEANYTNDTLDGARILFFENGDTMQVEYYKMGQFEGSYEEYFNGGKLKTSGQYEANAMKGKWTVYYNSGQVKEEVTFEGNEENGPFIEYYRNGNLKAEGAYLNGDFEHGPLSLYNEEGELIRKMECDKGICRTVWLSPKAVNSEEEQ